MELLLVEDNLGDIRLIEEVLKDSHIRVNMSVARDGVEAISFLKRQGRFADAPRPQIILLDLNMPRISGREVLAFIKADSELKRIPVIVFTTSDDERDIRSSYDLHANCYVTKPADFNQFIHILHIIESFWLGIVKLPA
mgnify:CR=1 FL=1